MNRQFLGFIRAIVNDVFKDEGFPDPNLYLTGRPGNNLQAFDFAGNEIVNVKDVLTKLPQNTDVDIFDYMVSLYSYGEYVEYSEGREFTRNLSDFLSDHANIITNYDVNGDAMSEEFKVYLGDYMIGVGEFVVIEHFGIHKVFDQSGKLIQGFKTKLYFMDKETAIYNTDKLIKVYKTSNGLEYEHDRIPHTTLAVLMIDNLLDENDEFHAFQVACSVEKIKLPKSIISLIGRFI
jgi:hypothetical protein